MLSYDFDVSALDPNTPILVGVAEIQQCEDDPSRAKEALALMVDALEGAARDACGAAAGDLLTGLEQLAIPQGLWHYVNPAGAVAAEVGAKGCFSVHAELGILQQSLMAQACEAIASGELNIAAVVGGEAKYRALRAQILDVALTDSQQETVPDRVLKPEAEFWDEVETAAGLAMPVGFYAIMESALRAEQKLDIETHRDQLADMYQAFAETAKDNPNAWHRDGMSAEQIRSPSAKNKMLAFPYTKFHNTQWNVDQAAALIFCSVRHAQALGIPQDKWIFPLGSAESNVMVNLAQRPELQGSAGATLAGEAVLKAAGLSVTDIDYFDLYSCFPAAVKIYARALGIDLGRQLTVTGGMTFAGGPLNNYVLQATARMATLLRDKPKAKGLISSVSGMLTKQAWGLWSSAPNALAFKNSDVSADVRAKEKVLKVVAPSVGEAVIVGYTVLYQGGQPQRLIAVCDLPTGDRTVVFSEQAATMQIAVGEECVGRAVRIVDERRFELL